MRQLNRLKDFPSRDGAFWDQRDPSGMLGHVTTGYFRYQAVWNHVPKKNKGHAIELVNKAVSGKAGWTRVNDNPMDTLFDESRPDHYQGNPDGIKIVMGLDFIFKDAVLENYDITVSRIQVEKKNPKAFDGNNSHMNKGQKSGGEFMRIFDKNRDGRITREEFPGPDRGFQKLDRDHNGYIDGQEALDKVPPKPIIKK